jgi:excisionase family DNA binding protein
MTDLISPQEAARRLGHSYGTLAVWRCTQRRKLPFVRLGRKIFYRPADLEKFIEESVHPGDGSQPTPPSKRK